MKVQAIIFFYVISLSAYSGLKSPFKSTVSGISINNTHAIGKQNKIYRGMAPLGKVQELKDFGITDILIFKNQTKDEINQEYDEIQSLYNPTVKQFDFLWHDFISYQESCQQVIEALKYIREVHFSPNRKLYLHCTVGEDRTGMLAGLWRMLSQKWSLRKTFYYELCERGYENGNGNKPDYVVNEIRQDLTPLFLYMARLVLNSKISLDNLDSSYCKDDIRLKHRYRCRTSSMFQPELK